MVTGSRPMRSFDVERRHGAGMSGPLRNALLLGAIAVVFFGLSLLARRLLGQREAHHNSWAATLSYIATAYGVVIGFSILFLFGQYADAKQAVGDEATSIGTAYEQASLFPQSQPRIQHALICYARAVPDHDWPALAAHRGGSKEVDAAFHDLVISVGPDDEPPVGALHAATATNLVSQIGNISTARETRLVAGITELPIMLWILLVGGGAFVTITIFVVTLPAGRGTQAGLVSMTAAFTGVMLLIVIALSDPFGPGGGRLTPQLIQETEAAMTTAASDVVAAPCEP